MTRLKKITHWFLGLATFFVLIVCALILKLDLLSDSMCGDYEHVVTQSPNKKFKAVTFIRDCGATTKAAVHVAIFEQSADITRINGFTSLFLSNEAVNNDGKQIVVAIWKTDELLQIESPIGIKFSNRTDRFKNIKIEYQQQNPKISEEVESL